MFCRLLLVVFVASTPGFAQVLVPAELFRAGVGGESTLRFTDGDVLVRAEIVERRASGLSVRGSVIPDGQFVLTVAGGYCTGGVWSDGAMRSLAPGALRGDFYHCAVTPAPPVACLHGQTHAAEPLPPAEPAVGCSFCECDDDPGFVDVLVVYTALARDAAGGAGPLMARVQNTIDTSNLVFENSQIADLQLHLAGFREVEYDEVSPEWLDHLLRVTETADGHMDEVHGWRDDDAADCVMLIVDDERFLGGAAWWAVWDQSLAFSVLNWRSAGGGSLTGPHEFGHNFGCAHDHENDVSAPFSYCWGHYYSVGQDTYGTVMSYVGQTLPTFSHPGLLGPGGEPLGVPPGEERAAYNALMVSKSRSVLANYRRSGRTRDCDNNGIDDAEDIAGGAPDSNGNGIPDACERRTFVDGEEHTEGDGWSWEASHRDLAETLATSNLRCADVMEIWVADGEYLPDSRTADPWRRFALRSGLGLYGGFEGRSHPDGGETSLDDRDPSSNPTVLSGDIGVRGDDSDNTYSVIEAIDVDATAILDGFTVKSGRSFADASGLYGVRSSPTVRRCVFKDLIAPGRGAAAAFYEGASPSFLDCRFQSNDSGWIAGAVGFIDSTGRFDRCWFESNSAASFGGAIDAWNSDLVVANSVFTSNSSGIDGGAIAIGGGATLDIVSSTVFANDATGVGGGLVSSTSTLRPSNSILWANTSGAAGAQDDQVFRYSGTVDLNYSSVEGLDGSLGGVGNTGSDPEFADGPGGDFMLSPGSPVIDAANNALVPPDTADADGDGETAEATPHDYSGGPRFLDDHGSPDTGVSGNGHPEVVDMGAFEFDGNSCIADFNGDGAVNTLDVLAFLNAWTAQDPSADINGDGQVNTLDVLAFLNAWTAGC